MALTTNISLGASDYMEQSSSIEWAEGQENDEAAPSLEEFMYYAAYCSSDDEEAYNNAQAEVNVRLEENQISVQGQGNDVDTMVASAKAPTCRKASPPEVAGSAWPPHVSLAYS